MFQPNLEVILTLFSKWLDRLAEDPLAKPSAPNFGSPPQRDNSKPAEPTGRIRNIAPSPAKFSSQCRSNLALLRVEEVGWSQLTRTIGSYYYQFKWVGI